MAAFKRRAVDDSAVTLERDNDDEMEDLSDEQDSDQQFIGENLNLEFEARTPEGSDFHGIKKLLHQLFLKSEVNISELTDMVISQNHVGSVIKQCEIPGDSDSEDDDDVFGVISALNMTRRQNSECIKTLQSFIVGKCEQHSTDNTRQQLSDVLDGTKQVGFFINERFINIPPQIATPMFLSLKKEMDASHSKKSNFKFDYCIMICKIFKSQPQPKKKGKKKAPPVEDVTFSNAEEELIEQESSFTFDYDVIKERDSALSGSWGEDDTPLLPWRRVMVFPGSKIEQITASIERTFSP